MNSNVSKRAATSPRSLSGSWCVCWWSVCRADCWPALQSNLTCVCESEWSMSANQALKLRGRTAERTEKLWSAVFFLYCWSSLPWERGCQMEPYLCLGLIFDPIFLKPCTDSYYTPAYIVQHSLACQFESKDFIAAKCRVNSKSVVHLMQFFILYSTVHTSLNSSRQTP